MWVEDARFFFFHIGAFVFVCASPPEHVFCQLLAPLLQVLHAQGIQSFVDGFLALFRGQAVGLARRVRLFNLTMYHEKMSRKKKTDELPHTLA